MIRALGLSAALAAGVASAAADGVGTGAVGATLDVAVRELPRTIVAEGQVEAIRQTTLGAQVAGRIVALDVKAGDSVRAGQVLARIDARTADQAVAAGRSQIAEAEANLANAKRKYERNRDLVAQKFVSQAALDQAEAEYKAAQAQLAATTANAGQAVAAQSLHDDHGAVRRRDRRDACGTRRHGAAGPAADHDLRSARAARRRDRAAGGACDAET